MLRKPLVILAWPVGDTLAAHIADVFDEVRPPQKDVDPPLTIEPCSHRPAEYADPMRNRTHHRGDVSS
jgi:hypothetical protein